jgi:CBS domain containing-hemolysin-like protein
VGGFVIATHGTIPAAGTVLKWNDLELKVLVSDARRVTTVEIKLVEKVESVSDE